MKRVLMLVMVVMLPLYAKSVKDQSEVLADTVIPTGYIDKGSYIEPPMVTLKAGKFEMGSAQEREAQPQHTVVIAYDFDVGIYEVTFDEYDRFCKSVGKTCPEDHYWGRGKRPVLGVNWKDAKSYTRWLSEQSGKKYRLLSEAEWEYAARAGTTTSYSFGESVRELDDHAWHEYNSGNVTHVVGQKQPNPWGLYDMYGNVWEWCEDGYIGDYRKAPLDGSARRGGLKKVLRGGGYGSYAAHMNSSKRFRLLQFLRSKKNGFRLARDH